VEAVNSGKLAVHRTVCFWDWEHNTAQSFPYIMLFYSSLHWVVIGQGMNFETKEDE